MNRGVWDARVAPRTVINDPALTMDTPDWLWVSTGMRALDHAIECAYPIRHQPSATCLPRSRSRYFENICPHHPYAG